MHGSSPQAQLLQKLVQQAALASVPVLLCGERGGGREFAARMLHERSGQTGVFLRLTCAGLAPSVLTKELASRVADARHGTLFIDAVEEAPIDIQTELAEMAKVGEVRLVGATTVSLPDDRLSSIFGIRITIAPLRECRSDIPVLVDQFILEAAERRSLNVDGIQHGTLKKLMGYPWPGNIRQLKDAVDRACQTAKGKLLDLEDFKFLVSSADERPLQFMIPGSTIQEIEREAILRTIEHAGGSTTVAARMLNMSVRKIQYKLKEYRQADDAAAEVRTRAQRA